MITIISGTNRPNSNTLKLAMFYNSILQKRNIHSEIISLENLPHPLIPQSLFTPEELFDRNPEFLPIQKKITNSKLFIFIIPEYIGSFPGSLKTFIDYCKYPDSFNNKKAALTGLSLGNYGNITGLEHFNTVCNLLDLHIVPQKVAIPKIENYLINNQINDEYILDLIQKQISQLIQE